MEQNWVAHTRRTKRSSMCGCTIVPMLLRRLVCRAWLFANAGMWWFVYVRRGFDLQGWQHFTTQVYLFHVDEAELQRTVVSRYLLGHPFQNQEIDRLKRWSGSEEVRALLLRCVFHLFHRQLAMNVQRAFVSFVLCPPISSCSLCGNHTHDNPKTTIHLHLTITSQRFQTCFCDQIRNQETSLNVVDAGLFLLQLISFTLSQRLSNRDHKFFAHCSKHFHVCERHLPALPSWTPVVVSNP